MKDHRVVLYTKEGRIARIVLNRPDRFNAISLETPSQLKEAVEKANLDKEVRVIILSGAGKGFCSGYDLKEFAEKPRPCPGSQNMPWDPIVDYQWMNYCTECYMSLWRSMKPVICKVHGYAVAGGSDIALCCDFVYMTKDAKIGYPPSVLWGCPTTAMWVYRLGLEKAKHMLFTGKLVNGEQAKQMGLISECFDSTEELDINVEEMAKRLSLVPSNQLAMQKMVINHAYESMGLSTSQKLATIMDGISRHTPEGCAFKKRAEEVGFKRAVHERDTNPDQLLQSKL